MPNEIKCFPIAKTVVDKSKVIKWLQELGVEDPDIIVDTLPSGSSGVIGLAGKRCYKSFEVSLNPNLTKVRKDWAAYFDHIFESGHGSIMEHASWTWAIENLTRVCTAEMNRHRAGVAISEGSMRYIRFDKEVPYWEPLSIRFDPYDEYEVAIKKRETRQIFKDAFNYSHALYMQLQEIWKDELSPESKFAQKKQITSMMRRIIPMGACTGAIYTFNFRALRHILTMRCEPAAEEEIVHACSQIAKVMVEEELGFKDFNMDNGYWAPKFRKI